MDDEAGVRDIARSLLEHLNYEVNVAAHGDEAVDLFRQAIHEGRPFDLVIVDLMVKGGKGGLETIEGLKSVNPDVRAVLSSGLSSDPVVAEYRRYGFSGIMPKPYRLREMENLLGTILFPGQ
jgi:CheY-like chemotaxis protein